MPSLHGAQADRNLLFGIIALQMDFIDREALVKSMSGWVLDKTKPLGHILRDQGALGQDELTLLEALVEKHLQKHGNDPEKSLAAVNQLDTSLDELHVLSDTDVQASLGHVSENKTLPDASNEQDPYHTVAFQGAKPGIAERYRILRPHAKGGLGQVSVALDQELHREVALKEIQNQYADNLENRARFLVEAEITGGLEHPGIVPVYGLGQYADGRPYYAMRFIRGDNLKEAVKRFHQAESGQRDPGKRMVAFRQLLGRFLDVCNAMAYAHARGVLHRDLKPGNIMLGQYGETLVVDWGLAKLVSQKETATTVQERPMSLSSSSNSTETKAGSALGTPQFMSPEQAAGRLDLLGPFSDVYSLGATLYYLLTDKAPFEDSDVGTVLQKVGRGEFPMPRQANASVPAPLEAVCLKAMALKPEDRYASPRALADDIEHWLADEPVNAWKEPWTVRAMRWARRHRPLVATAAGLLLTAVTALTFSTILISREHAATELARRDAQSNYEKAKNLAEENRRQLVRIYVNNGVRQLDDGKPEQAVVWFAEALDLDKDHPDKVAMHRLRLSAALQSCSKIVQILWHNGPISNAEFSPDGLRVVTASEDGTARIWDAATGKTLGDPLKHKDTVRHASFSADGQYVVTASNDQTAVVWDAAKCKSLHAPLKHGDLVQRAIFSHDGRRVLTVSKDRSAKVWDKKTGEQLAELKHGQFVYFAAFSPDDTRVVTASADMSVQIWNVATGRELTPPLRTSHYVLSAAFSPDGERIVTGAKNGVVVVREASGARPPLTFATLGEQVDRVSFTADGNRILSVSASGAQLWEAATTKRLLLLPAKAYWEMNPNFSTDGRYRLFWSSHDHAVRIRDEATGRPRSVPLGNLKLASLHRAGNRVVAVGVNRLVHVWDTATGKAISPSLEAGASLSQAWLSPNEQTVLGIDKLTARIWDAHTGKALTPAMTHATEIRFAAFSPDSRRLVTASENNNNLRIWDTATGKVLCEFAEHQDVPLHAAFSPNGNLVISSGQDNTARLWDAATGKALDVPPLRHPNPSFMRHAAFSFDGKQVVTVSSKSAFVWDATSGKKLSGPLKHTGRIAEASFSPDGRKVITVSNDTGDRTAQVWDAVTGDSIAPPMEHKDVLRHAWFSTDEHGLRVLTTTDRYARVWDASTGEAVTPRLDHDNLFDAAFAPDGFGVITVGKDGTVRAWDLPRDERPSADLVQLARLVSGYRLDPDKGLVPCSPMMLRESWNGLREKYPSDFRCPEQTVLAWHRQEADDAEKTTHWKEALLHLNALANAEPAQPSLHLRRGKALEELGQWDKALTAYTRALESKPDDAELHFKRGRAHARLGNLDKALIDYQKALDLRPEDGAVWLARHLVHAQLGQAEDAKADYENAVLHSPMHAPRIDCFWNSRGVGASPVVSAHWREVGADCSAAIDSKKAKWWTLRARGLAQGVLAQRDVEKWKSAAADFDKAVLMEPDDWRAWQGLARCLAEVGGRWTDTESAALQAISRADRLKMPEWGSKYLLGISQKERKEHRSAIDAYSDAHADAKKLGVKAWGILAERAIARNEIKDYGLAIKDCDEILRDHAEAAIYNIRANGHNGKKDYDKAFADFAKAIELEPQTPLFWRDRGLLYRKLEEHDKAFAHYDKAILLNPKYADAYVSRGNLHYSRAAYQPAIAAYSEALAINPTDSYAHRWRGLSYASLLEFDRAILDYSESIRFNPKDALVHINRGYAYQKKGNRKKAIDDYVKAKELDADLIAPDLNLAKIKAAEGKTEEVEEIFRVLLAKVETKAKESPSNTTHQSDLAWVLESVALVRELRGKLADAEPACRRALKIREDLAREYPKQRYYQVSVAFCQQRLGSILWDAKQTKEAEKALRASLTSFKKVVDNFPDVAESHNGYAWSLAVCPDPNLRDPCKAVPVAWEAVRLAPAGNYWNTLGVAQYRAGELKEAINSLEKSMALNFGGEFADWIFLAMAHQRLDDPAQARHWYDKAVEALEKDLPTEERLRFRVEAIEVLGLAAAPKGPPQPNSKD